MRELKTMYYVSTAYLIANNQLCTNYVAVTASSNQEGDRVTRDVKE